MAREAGRKWGGGVMAIGFCAVVAEVDTGRGRRGGSSAWHGGDSAWHGGGVDQRRGRRCWALAAVTIRDRATETAISSTPLH